MATAPDSFIPTRRSLLIRLQNLDDQTSWRDFFDIYAKLIYGVAIKTGLSDTEAQEVVQETIIAVSKNIGGFEYDRTKGTFKSWLLHTARWRITDQLRRRQLNLAGGPRGENDTARTTFIERIPDPAGDGLDSIWETEWEKQILDAAVARVKRRVKSRQYQMFDLYVMKQWPVRKVADTLRVSIGQVYLAKHRIGALIKKELKILADKGR
jgi:RNA polymerase sigma-70 factor (ECF subfamily)